MRSLAGSGVGQVIIGLDRRGTGKAIHRRDAETQRKAQSSCHDAPWWNGTGNLGRMPPRMGAWQPGRLRYGVADGFPADAVASSSRISFGSASCCRRAAVVIESPVKATERV